MVIDEFSKNLEQANNKYGNGQLKTANTKMMEAFSAQDGEMRPMSYSMVGLSKAKQKEMAEYRVKYPSLTLCCLSTPDDFFKNIGEESIKDGFINRFLICISDADRTPRRNVPYMDVPQSIIDWDYKIKQRIGNQEDIAEDAPALQYLNITNDAYKVYQDYDAKCIDLANDLDEFQMGETTSRAAEISLRLAMIIALSENPNAEKITEDHVQKAIEWVDFNLLRAINEIKQRISGSDYESHKKEIMTALRSKSISRSDMHKRAPYSKYKTKDLNEILNALYESGLAETQEVETKGRTKILWTAT